MSNQIGELNSLTDQKQKITESINSLEGKKTTAENLSKTLPNKKQRLKSELNILKTIDLPLVNLNETLNVVGLDITKTLGLINKNEYESQKLKVKDNSQSQKDSINMNIENVNKQLSNVDASQKRQKDLKKQDDNLINSNKTSISTQNSSNRKRLISLSKSPSIAIAAIIAEQALSTLMLININISSLNNKIEDLNEFIEEANTPNKIQQVKIQQNALSAESIKTKNEIEKFKAKIKQLENYLNIFNTIVTVLLTLPIPTSVPPGVGIPLSIINKITNILQRMQSLVAAISSLLSILLAELLKITGDINNTQSNVNQISKDIDNSLQNAQLSTQSNQISNIPANNNEEIKTISESSTPNEFGILPGSNYKGFKFAIKEENTPGAPVVLGYKRHYASAIDRSGVEVLKTEPSFTQDTEILIDTLKYIIDSSNLIT